MILDAFREAARLALGEDGRMWTLLVVLTALFLVGLGSPYWDASMRELSP